MSLIYSSVIPNNTKWSFVTRRVNRNDVKKISKDLSTVKSGDLVLGQIIEVNQHKKIQLAEGRGSQSYVGDHVVLVCADRYAPDQFEGVALLNCDASDLLAGGGLLGKLLVANEKMDEPTKIKPLGLLKDNKGVTINVKDYAIKYKQNNIEIPVIGVVGTSMNAGKTTTAASLGFGFKQLGCKVAALKITGTGAFGDFNAFSDAGCDVVADFTDAGMASTYKQPMSSIIKGAQVLLSHAIESKVDVAIVEIADGVFQSETEILLGSDYIQNLFDGVIFAASDALSAISGVKMLRYLGLTPVAISGLVTRSPLAIKEILSNEEIEVATRAQLCDPNYVNYLFKNNLSTTNKNKSNLVGEVAA